MTRKLSEKDIVLIGLISKETKNLRILAQRFKAITGGQVSLTTISKYKGKVDTEVHKGIMKLIADYKDITYLSLANTIANVNSGQAQKHNEIFAHYLSVLKTGPSLGRFEYDQFGNRVAPRGSAPYVGYPKWR